ncbi:hypothetical protein HK101_011773 [Irineochytrium annulatum]|nr:hypothetical protein HK101_011773 [Irineochytrium annulatum]
MTKLTKWAKYWAEYAQACAALDRGRAAARRILTAIPEDAVGPLAKGRDFPTLERKSEVKLRRIASGPGPKRELKLSGREVNLPEMKRGRFTEYVPFNERIREALAEPVNPDELQITPSGKVYMPEASYHRVLMNAFGIGRWHLQPDGELSRKGKRLSRHYTMWAHDRYIATACGEGVHREGDGREAIDGVWADALRKCSKDLGIFSDLEDSSFIDIFVKERCMKKKNASGKYEWLLKARK